MKEQVVISKCPKKWIDAIMDVAPFRMAVDYLNIEHIDGYVLCEDRGLVHDEDNSWEYISRFMVCERGTPSCHPVESLSSYMVEWVRSLIAIAPLAEWTEDGIATSSKTTDMLTCIRV